MDEEMKINEKTNSSMDKTENEYIAQKRKTETEVVELMITLFCHKKHKTKSKQLCPECQSLFDYAANRIAKCPHMATKTFCTSCKTPCYRADMREKITEVMKWSGPRIIFYHPIMVIRHIAESKRNKKRDNQQKEE